MFIDRQKLLSKIFKKVLTEMASKKQSKSAAPSGEVLDIGQLPIQQLNQLTQSLDKVRI